MTDRQTALDDLIAGDADLYERPAHGWTCYHCGDTFKTPGAARDHFGFDPSADPACRIKIGAERGLVMALRKAEKDCDQLRHLLHDEASEAYRLYADQTIRHQEQMNAAEELGYERGLADGRAEAASARIMGDKDWENPVERPLSPEVKALVEAVRPFERFAHSALSEAPHDADRVYLCNSSDGSTISVSLDDCRSLQSALAAFEGR